MNFAKNFNKKLGESCKSWAQFTRNWPKNVPLSYSPSLKFKDHQKPSDPLTFCFKHWCRTFKSWQIQRQNHSLIYMFSNFRTASFLKACIDSNFNTFLCNKFNSYFDCYIIIKPTQVKHLVRAYTSRGQLPYTLLTLSTLKFTTLLVLLPGETHHATFLHFNLELLSTWKAPAC